MKKIATLLALSALAFGAAAQDHYVAPYYRSDGTYVQGHHQTNPGSSRANNYSSQGNMNPYTGQVGTVNPYEQPQSLPYIPPPQYPNPQNYPQAPQSIWPQRRY